MTKPLHLQNTSRSHAVYVLLNRSPHILPQVGRACCGVLEEMAANFRFWSAMLTNLVRQMRHFRTARKAEA
ncbi:hypothetical protein BaRGS_00025136, partial [Batillaria attramentaria]